MHKLSATNRTKKMQLYCKLWAELL